MKKTIAILLAFCLCVGLCACSTNTNYSKYGENTEKSEYEKVHDAVEMQRMVTEATDKKFSTIGGNQINSVRITITNTEKISDTEYVVNGRITKIDVYGTSWNNTFDCSVITSDNGESWDAGRFQYKSDSWTKG